jgi:hypothetical protein
VHVELIRETGEVVKSAKGCAGLFHRVEGDEDSRLVRYIDPYGDTYFNRLQMADFLADWDERYPSAGPTALQTSAPTWAAGDRIPRGPGKNLIVVAYTPAFDGDDVAGYLVVKPAE